MKNNRIHIQNNNQENIHPIMSVLKAECFQEFM